MSLPLVFLLDVLGCSLEAASGRSLLQAQFAHLRFLHAELPLFLLLLALLDSCRSGSVSSCVSGIGPETRSGTIRTGASFLCAQVIRFDPVTSVTVQSRRDALIAAVSDSEARLAVRLLVSEPSVLPRLSSDAHRVQRVFSAPRGSLIQILSVGEGIFSHVPCVGLRAAGALLLLHFICRHTHILLTELGPLWLLRGSLDVDGCQRLLHGSAGTLDVDAQVSAAEVREVDVSVVLLVVAQDGLAALVDGLREDRVLHLLLRLVDVITQTLEEPDALQQRQQVEGSLLQRTDRSQSPEELRTEPEPLRPHRLLSVLCAADRSEPALDAAAQLVLPDSVGHWCAPLDAGSLLGGAQERRHHSGQEHTAARHQQTALQLVEDDLGQVERRLGQAQEVADGRKFPQTPQRTRLGLRQKRALPVLQILHLGLLGLLTLLLSLSLLVFGSLQLLQSQRLHHDGLAAPPSDAPRHPSASGRRAQRRLLILRPEAASGGHGQRGLLPQRPGQQGELLLQNDLQFLGLFGDPVIHAVKAVTVLQHLSEICHERRDRLILAIHELIIHLSEAHPGGVPGAHGTPEGGRDGLVLLREEALEYPVGLLDLGREIVLVVRRGFTKLCRQILPL